MFKKCKKNQKQINVWHFDLWLKWLHETSVSQQHLTALLIKLIGTWVWLVPWDRGEVTLGHDFVNVIGFLHRTSWSYVVTTLLFHLLVVKHQKSLYTSLYTYIHIYVCVCVRANICSCTLRCKQSSQWF